LSLLGDVPLEVRVGGALDAILSGAVHELAERYAVLAIALWPPDVAVSGEIAEPARARGAKNRWPADVRTAAVAAYGTGAGSYTAVGLQWGVPGTTVKDWVRRAASEYDLTAHADRRSSRGGVQSDRRRSG
jgi:hypothetical protein